MQNKKKIHDGLHRGVDFAEKEYNLKDNHYDYGPLGRLPIFSGLHPAVMDSKIQEIFWTEQLNYSKKWSPNRPLNKHEKWNYKAITWIENKFNGGKELFGYKNWDVI